MTLIFLIFAGLFAVPVKGQGRLTMPQYLQDPNTDDESGGLTEMNGGPSGGIVPFQMPQMSGRFPLPQGSGPFAGSQGLGSFPGSQGPSPFQSQNMGMNPNRGMFGPRPQAGMGNDDNSLFLPSDPFQNGRAQNSFPMSQGQQGGMNPFSSMPSGTSRIVTFPQMFSQGSSPQQGGNNIGQRMPSFSGQSGSPFDSNMSPFGQNFDPNNPNFDQSGTNFRQNGPSFRQGGQNGQWFGPSGSPFGQNGIQNGFQGSPFRQGGSPNDLSDSPFNQQTGFQGPLSGQSGFPGSSFGQPGQQGSPFSQFGGFSPRGPQGISFGGRTRPNMNEDDFGDSLSGGQRSLNGMQSFNLAPDNEGNTNPYIPGFGFVKGINGMGPGGPNAIQAGNFNSQRGQIPDYDADQNGINDGQSGIGGPLCPNKMGMYGDPQSSCSVYYMCQRDGRRDTYSCPTTTKFNNKIGVCDYATNVDDNCNPLSDASELSSKRRYISPSASEKSKENKTKNISKKSDSKTKSKDQ